jgi:ornithine carbamoyltransferase
MRHLLTPYDLTTEEIRELFAETARLKKGLRQGKRPSLLNNHTLGLIFEKPSLRTRASFQVGMAQLGGSSYFFPAKEVGLGERETLADFARTLSEYVDAVVLRTFAHATVKKFAEHASVPTINGLSDLHHPCQALADLFTMQEMFGTIQGRKLVFIGDGNNVSRSLAVVCEAVGVRFTLAAPKGYSFDDAFLKEFSERFPKNQLQMESDPGKAVRDADVLYTDVWTSMGQEAEQAARKQAFAGHQVNSALLAQAPTHALVMHCLPAHRGEEITDEIVDGERSVVFTQAGNRMHVQKTVLLWLLGKLEQRLNSRRGRRN